MLSYNIVHDSDIMAINRSKQENASDSIVYRDTSGVLHTIDLEVCAKNYSEITGLNNNLVGERKIDEHYVLLYTSGVPTKIIFSKFFIMPRYSLPISFASPFITFVFIFNNSTTCVITIS